MNTDDKRKNEIIVSLTSFPGRIDLVHRTLYSLINQTYKPDRLILWLAECQFENRVLPDNLLELQAYGLTIEWVKEDLKSYKKLIPAIEKFPNAIIVTADDDLYYPVYWLSSLVKSYRKYPNEIHCHLITRIKKQNNKIKFVKRDNSMINKASFNNKLLGGSGTLYPPCCLDKRVSNREVFQEIASSSDDIWFWGAAVSNNIKIRWIKNNMKKLYYTEDSQETDCLWKINDVAEGETIFEKHLQSVARYYGIESKID